MNDKGINQKLSILSYMKELKKVQKYIDNISSKSVKDDNKYAEILNYLQQRKKDLQYEIQEHAKHSQEIYKEKLEEVKDLIKKGKDKITKLEESTAIKGKSPETLAQNILEGEQKETVDLIDLVVSKDTIEELTKVSEYLQKEIAYFQAIKILDNKENDITDDVTPSSYNQEFQTIENIVKNFEFKDEDVELGRYLNQRKYGIYYNAQKALDKEINKYTDKLNEIETIISSHSEKQNELLSTKDGKEETIESESDFQISSEVRKELSKVTRNLSEYIEFLETVDLETQLHTNQEVQKTNTSNEETKKVKEANTIVDKQDTPNLPIPVGKFAFLKNPFTKLKDILTPKSKKNKTEADPTTNKDENEEEKPKNETFREQFGGYNKSQKEFENNAKNAVKQQEKSNSEVNKETGSEYVE